MEISKNDIEQVLSRFFRRGEAAIAAGGIAHQDVVDGAEVPDGWKLDYGTGLLAAAERQSVLVISDH